MSSDDHIHVLAVPWRLILVMVVTYKGGTRGRRVPGPGLDALLVGHGLTQCVM